MVVRIRCKTSPAQRALVLAAHCVRTHVQARYRHALLLAAPLVGLLCFASATADATVQAAMNASHCLTAAELEAIPYIPALDPRYARIEKFFRRYRCPAPQFIDEYLHLADKNGLDYRLLPAISIRETQCGVHEKGNNRLGYHPSTVSFPSVFAGIEFMAKRLGRHPYYRGKTLESLLFKYNPRPAYPGEVRQIMRQIEP
ncbi:MAG: hypothetical protein ABL995_18725 [Bryobacteraceae bacterium]